MAEQPIGAMAKRLAIILKDAELAGEGEAEAVANVLLRAAHEYADLTTKYTVDAFQGKHRAIFEELAKQMPLWAS